MLRGEDVRLESLTYGDPAGGPDREDPPLAADALRRRLVKETEDLKALRNRTSEDAAEWFAYQFLVVARPTVLGVLARWRRILGAWRRGGVLAAPAVVVRHSG